MSIPSHNTRGLIIRLTTFLLLGVFAFWVKHTAVVSDWQQAGLTTFSLGFILLASYLAAHILGLTKLPLISGYIFMGIIAGPHVTGFLDEGMVVQFRMVDDLALSFIALTAGGTLRLDFIQKRFRALSVNILCQVTVIFGLVFACFIMIHRYAAQPYVLSWNQIMVMGCLLGVIAMARSPSSAIAVISECRAKGPFTSTVLGVTIAMDVLVIVLFTVAMTVSHTVVAAGGPLDYRMLAGLGVTVASSLAIGAALGKGISLYVEKIGRDLPLFLLFCAFGVFRLSHGFNHYMETRFAVSLVLEPLLICISAGFTVQNFSNVGRTFMDHMENMALPIYVVFFSLAGASLDLAALRMTWPLAVCLVMLRAAGIFGGTWLAGVLNKDKRLFRHTEWMAYLTQAGVSIGLAQLAQREFPDVGTHLTTLVLAVICINQVIGPIIFKMALNMTGEAGNH